MNRSTAAIGIGVLAIAVIVGVILFLQLPSPDMPANQALVPVVPAPSATGRAPADTAMKRERAVSAQRGARVPSGPKAPQFDVVRVDKKGNVVIAGKADPDCAITVRDGDTMVGTAMSDRRGDWVIVPGEPLAAGESQLNLSSKCGGAAAMTADRVIVLIVPQREPSATMATAQAGGSAEQSVADVKGGRTVGDRAIVVAIPRDSARPSEVMQAPVSKGTGIAVGAIDYDDKGQVVVSGKAEPGSKVQVYLDNRIVGRTQAGPDGTWRLSPDSAVAAGKYTLRVDQVTVDGKVVARAEIPFVRGEPLTDLPDARIVVIQPGDYLWRIARASYGAGARYTLIYDANRGQISDPDLIYPGQVFTLPRVN